MKKLTSFFVLAGIVLSSFFAQEANAYSGSEGFSIYEAHPENAGFKFHKLLVFSEINKESEDSEVDPDEFKLLYTYVSTKKFDHIKNILNTCLYSTSLTQQDKFHLPLFLVVRSIRI